MSANNSANNTTYTIKEVSEITGYEAHVIRFYEKEFGLEIPRNKSNHRYFTQKEIDQLQNIKRMQSKGFSNTQIKLILANPELLANPLAQIGDAAAANAMAIPSFSEKSMEEYMEAMKNEIIEEIKNQLEFHQQPYQMALTGLAEEVKELSAKIQLLSTTPYNNDVILCENAKLKMQLKQRTLENIDLREQLKKERSKKNSFLKRLFGKKD